MVLRGKNIYIRPIVNEDAGTVLKWENNPENWIVSGTQEEYVLEDILDLIDSMKDVTLAKQTRFIICFNESDELIGAIDLFDIQFDKNTAGLGILIADKKHRKQGFAYEAIELLETFAKEELFLSEIHCSVHENNIASLRLFEKAGYNRNGEVINEENSNNSVILFGKWLRK